MSKAQPDPVRLKPTQAQINALAVAAANAEKFPPPEGPGFKELEFREHVPGAYFAIGPFGVEYRVWDRGVTWACRAVDRDWVAQNFPTLSAAVKAANEHCHKELRGWVR